MVRSIAGLIIVEVYMKSSDVFFFNLTAPQCDEARLGTNDACMVTIIPKG